MMKRVIFITEKFMKLDPEKKKIILDAAFEEFADYGYEYASTNRIVQKAKIGKGMLFYYFNSKKELFHYLIDFGIDVTEEYINKIDESESDFIEKYKHILKIKMKAYAKNPHIFNFFGTLYINEYDGLPEALKDRLLEIKDRGYAKIFNNIDKSLFREDIDSDQILRLIHLTITGYENELVNGLKGLRLSSVNYDPYWDEFDDLLALLKKIYYK